MSFTGSDGIAETFEEHLRAALLVATQVAQQRMQRRADQAREEAAAERAAAQESSDAQRQQLTAQREQQRAAQQAERAERDAVIADLRKVNSDTWWENADVDEIRRTWTSAVEYHAEDPRAADAAWRMADRFRDLGIADPTTLGDQPELALRTPLSDDELRSYQQHLDQQAARYQERADAGENVTAERRELDELRGAVSEELATEPLRRGGPPLTDQAETITVANLYDSHERREQLSQRLRALGVDEETTHAVHVADQASAKPVADAVTAGRDSTRATPARRTPSRQKKLRRSA